MKWCAGLLLLAGLGSALGGQEATAQRRTVPIDSTASVIHYTGSAPMHDWTGTTRSVRGTLRVDLNAPDSSRVHVRAPVANFDSGNDRRDRKMREVTEADRYPVVEFRATEISSEVWGRSRSGKRGQWRVDGPLTFHGQTHRIEATVDVRVAGDSLAAHARFPVSLTRFGVERPGFLGGLASIADTIRVEARIRGHAQPLTP
jgi:polyisoprenoid-binding protein YceI